MKTNETCLPNNGNWIISNGSGDGSWYDAGNQLKVQCGKPKSIEGMVYNSNFICCHMKIKKVCGKILIFLNFHMTANKV